MPPLQLPLSLALMVIKNGVGATEKLSEPYFQAWKSAPTPCYKLPLGSIFPPLLLFPHSHILEVYFLFSYSVSFVWLALISMFLSPPLPHFFPQQFGCFSSPPTFISL